MAHYVIPYGTTEYQDFRLKADGAYPDLAGTTLGIEITDSAGAAVSGAGTASWLNAATTTARFAPTGTLPRGSYSVRWTVTSGGRMFKDPNGLDPDVWTVPNP